MIFLSKVVRNQSFLNSASEISVPGNTFPPMIGGAELPVELVASVAAGAAKTKLPKKIIPKKITLPLKISRVFRLKVLRCLGLKFAQVRPKLSIFSFK